MSVLNRLTINMEPAAAPLTVGRDAGDTYFVDSPVVSRGHLRATHDGMGWRVVDRSANGTYSEDGVRVGEVLFETPVVVILGAGEHAVRVELVPLPQPISAPTSVPPSAPQVSRSQNPLAATLPPVNGTPSPRALPLPVPAPAASAPPQGPPPTVGPPLAPFGPQRVWVAHHAAAPAPAPALPQPPVSAHHNRAATQPGRTFQISTRPISIGRDSTNDIVIDDLLASRQHATISPLPNGAVQLEDHSANGTFVGGTKVRRQGVVIAEGTSIVIGKHTYLLRGHMLVEHTDVGSVTFDAVNLVVRGNRDAVLLDGVSLSLGDNQMLAVLGPSGSGKSTLTKALTGFKPASGGRVFYDGRDLYANYDELRTRIGYVPQEDILHPQLHVEQALQHAARLRFPKDVTAGEINGRIREVLLQLGLAEHRHKPIAKLSGGQKKRVSVALELMTKPSMIFLDEPTSGLDPGFERSVMAQLRQLADEGCTIVVVTHSTESLELCDRVLVLAKGGRVAYYGPPAERAAHFGTDSWADIFDQLEHDTTTDWKTRFIASPTYQRYVAPALGMAHNSAGEQRQRRLAPRLRSPISQFVTLVKRYVAVMASDRRNLVMLLAQAPVVGLMLMLLSRTALYSYQSDGRVNGKSSLALLSLVLAITYMGGSNAIREIVKELPIYRRERAFGLSIPAYVGSKVFVLSILTVIQAFVLVVFGLAFSEGPVQPAGLLSSGMSEIVVSAILTGVVAVTIGLLVSAAVNNADKATTILPVLLLAMYLFSGGPADPHNYPLVGELSYLNSAKWGFSAMASSADLQRLNKCNGHKDRSLAPFEDNGRVEDGGSGDTKDMVPTKELDDRCKALWDHNAGRLTLSWFALLVLGAMAVAGTGSLLIYKERKHGLAG